MQEILMRGFRFLEVSMAKGRPEEEDQASQFAGPSDRLLNFNTALSAGFSPVASDNAQGFSVILRRCYATIARQPDRPFSFCGVRLCVQPQPQPRNIQSSAEMLRLVGTTQPRSGPSMTCLPNQT